LPPSLRREVVEMAERTCPACGSLHHRPRNRLCGRCEYIRRRDVLLSTCRQDTEDVHWVEDALRRSPRWCRIVGRALADALGIEL